MAQWQGTFWSQCTSSMEPFGGPESQSGILKWSQVSLEISVWNKDTSRFRNKSPFKAQKKSTQKTEWFFVGTKVEGVFSVNTCFSPLQWICWNLLDHQVWLDHFYPSWKGSSACWSLVPPIKSESQLSIHHLHLYVHDLEERNPHVELRCHGCHLEPVAGWEKQRSSNYQPKHCTIIREIPQNYLTFVLFDSPKMSNFMIPDQKILGFK